MTEVFSLDEARQRFHATAGPFAKNAEKKLTKKQGKCLGFTAEQISGSAKSAKTHRLPSKESGVTQYALLETIPYAALSPGFFHQSEENLNKSALML